MSWLGKSPPTPTPQHPHELFNSFEDILENMYFTKFIFL